MAFQTLSQSTQTNLRDCMSNCLVYSNSTHDKKCRSISIRKARILNDCSLNTGQRRNPRVANLHASEWSYLSVPIWYLGKQVLVACFGRMSHFCWDITIFIHPFIHPFISHVPESCLMGQVDSFIIEPAYGSSFEPTLAPGRVIRTFKFKQNE